MNRFLVYKSKIRPEFWVAHRYDGTTGKKWAFPTHAAALGYAIGFIDGESSCVARQAYEAG